MKDFKQKADNAVFVASAIGPWGILMLIVAIAGLVKCCVIKPPDLTEESINKSGNIVEHVMVLDSTNNGFRVVYATAEAVTNEKYEEIRERPHIRTRFDRLKIEAPKHFGGSLLDTDICDFALYAYRFPIDNDLRIHNIFVAGKEKMNFYVQPKPSKLCYLDEFWDRTGQPIPKFSRYKCLSTKWKTNLSLLKVPSLVASL